MSETKKKRIKWNINKVRHFVEVESGSGCKLLSEEYVRSVDNLKFKCKCGNIFERSFGNFKKWRQYVCPKCKPPMRRKTQKKFIDEVFKLVGNEYRVIGEYINANTKITLLHDSCNRSYEVAPSSFLSGTSRCRYCAQDYRTKKQTKRHDVFIEEVYNLYRDRYTVLDEYRGAKTKITLIHNVCDGVIKITPTHLLSGKEHCSNCAESKGEKIITHLLKSNNIKYETQYRVNECRYNNTLPFDFYLEKFLIIEYDGVQHFKPTDFAGRGKGWANEQYKKNKTKDNIKNQYCIDNNVPLIRIPYWEFDSIEYIMNNVLKYFNIIDDECEDKEIVEKYYVKDGWCQGTYLSWDKNKPQQVL